MKSILPRVLLISSLVLELHGATPTFTFENPGPLTAGGAAINLGNHAVPRLVDWDNDGRLDLLVAGGDGYLWLFRQGHATNSTDFLAGSRLTASGPLIRAGTGYTGACFADINGDGLRDLIVAGNDNRVCYYANIGSPSAPAFQPGTVIPGSAGAFILPESVGGRIDIADWDGDGVLDLITGDYDGVLTWYRNAGTIQSPAFATTGGRLCREGVAVHEPHNIHPRVFDFNQDGIPDLAFGINWGYVKVLMNTEGFGATNFAGDYLLRDTNGLELNIRALNGDDTTPDFADLNGDGVLDLISGGINGKLFFMAGVSHARTFQQIESILAAHTDDLGPALAADANLRDTLFGLHRGIRSLAVGGVLPLSDRQAIRDWYRGHIGRYPQYLTKRQLNAAVDAYVPHLAGQVWVNLFESLPDTPAHRLEVAAACGFNGTHSNLLVDLGMLYIENSRSTAVSQKALYDIAASIPAPLQIVERVTQDDYLRPAPGCDLHIEARSGVNVFAQVGNYTEGFPPDVPQTLIDGFCVVVAHELNHNVETAASRIYPWFQDRKYDLLKQAAPPHLIFLDRHTSGFGLDHPATQTNFLARGYWDGVADHWDDAYDAYWSTGPGAGFDRHWLRDNLRFCIDAPQEAFATLANQYFTSSEVMLQLAVARWRQGITNCLNQVLLFADVYSLGSNQTCFYRVNTSGLVNRSAVRLQRDARGHIRGLTTASAHYEFRLDAEGNVLDFLQTPANAPMPRALLRSPARGTIRLSLTSSPAFRLVVETSADLRIWSPLQEFDPFSGVAEWEDTVGPAGQKFYRLRRDW